MKISKRKVIAEAPRTFLHSCNMDGLDDQFPAIKTAWCLKCDELITYSFAKLDGTSATSADLGSKRSKQ